MDIYNANGTDISSIQFGIYSRDEIHDISVVNINSNKLNGPNSVYDPRLGVLENNKQCITCGQDNKKCPGHFGYIDLNYNIIHPLFYKNIVVFLKCFCTSCSAVLITKEQIELLNLDSYVNKQKFQQIVKYVENNIICMNCGEIQPKVTFNPTEKRIFLTYKSKEETIKTQISEIEISQILQNITNEDLEILGLNSTHVHPKNCILSSILVLPTVSRPYIISQE